MSDQPDLLSVHLTSLAGPSSPVDISCPAHLVYVVVSEMPTSVEHGCLYNPILFFLGITSFLLYAKETEIRGQMFSPQSTHEALPPISQIQSASAVDFHAGKAQFSRLLSPNTSDESCHGKNLLLHI